MNDLKEQGRKLIGLFNGKWLFVIGIIGIVLIYFSSLIPKSAEKKSTIQKDEQITNSQICEEFRNKASDIVISITGDTSPTVVITLDSGAQYVYAGDEKQKNASETEETEREYVTVKDSDGEEKAVIITEYMPQIRGVAVVCIHGSNERIREEITNAISAALGVNRNKIYVTGTD